VSLKDHQDICTKSAVVAVTTSSDYLSSFDLDDLFGLQYKENHHILLEVPNPLKSDVVVVSRCFLCLTAISNETNPVSCQPVGNILDCGSQISLIDLTE